MSNYDFILKSGEKLHITSCPLKLSGNLMEAVTKITRTMSAEQSVDDVGVVFDAKVREAIEPCFAYAMWGIHRVSMDLFDDPKVGEKATSDYIEICGHIIKVNSQTFFLNYHSKSTTSQLPDKENQGSR